MTKREMKAVMKLGKYTTEYLALEREKETYYRLHIRDISRTAIVTLYLMQKDIDSVIRKIIRLVDRLMTDGVDFDNEVALMVYDTYESVIRRGLSDLL